MMILRVRRRHLSVLVIVCVWRWWWRRSNLMMSSRWHHPHHVRNVHSRFSRRDFLLRQRFLRSVTTTMIIVALPSIPRVRATENDENRRQEEEKNETRRSRNDSFHLLSLSRPSLCLSFSLSLYIYEVRVCFCGKFVWKSRFLWEKICLFLSSFTSFLCDVCVCVCLSLSLNL